MYSGKYNWKSINKLRLNVVVAVDSAILPPRLGIFGSSYIKSFFQRHLWLTGYSTETFTMEAAQSAAYVRSIGIFLYNVVVPDLERSDHQLV